MMVAKVEKNGLERKVGSGINEVLGVVEAVKL